VPTNKQRRDAARRHLERQLERRQERELRRRKFNLIASIVGTLVLIGAIVAVVALANSGDSKKKAFAGSGSGSSSSAASTTPTPTPTPSAAASTAYKPAVGAAVSFDGVTVKGATDLAGIPGVSSTSKTGPAKLEVKDLVVGKGAAATPTSTVNVQYYGVLYRNGKEFDSSWSRGMPTSFGLTAVVPGFTQGIGGTTGIAPMRVGGRRIIIMPAADGYGSQANGSIPANSPLVFVVDLLSVTAPATGTASS
jgi:peptidylprolyl isomerase